MKRLKAAAVVVAEAAAKAVVVAAKAVIGAKKGTAGAAAVVAKDGAMRTPQLRNDPLTAKGA